MKLLTLICLGTLLYFIVPKQSNAAEPDSYRLSADDQISVTVFNEADLSIDRVRIGSTGTISMPLLGQVDIDNLTATEVERKLSTLLLDGYLKKPNVTVTITEYRPFYINGEVAKPGSYPYRKGLTVQKAVVLAGGFTERAAKSGISLVSEEDTQFEKPVSLSDSIQPGDVITVDESFF